MTTLAPSPRETTETLREIRLFGVPVYRSRTVVTTSTWAPLSAKLPEGLEPPVELLAEADELTTAWNRI